MLINVAELHASFVVLISGECVIVFRHDHVSTVDVNGCKNICLITATVSIGWTHVTHRHIRYGAVHDNSKYSRGRVLSVDMSHIPAPDVAAGHSLLNTTTYTESTSCSVEEAEWCFMSSMWGWSLHFLGRCSATMARRMQYFELPFLSPCELRHEHWATLFRFAKTSKRFQWPFG